MSTATEDDAINIGSQPELGKRDVAIFLNNLPDQVNGRRRAGDNH